MSADNCILVAKMKNKKWRVAHIQNLENIYIKPNGEWSSEVIPQEIYVILENAKVCRSKRKAMDYAISLYNDCGYVEYGIKYLNIPFTWKEIVSASIVKLENLIQSGELDGYSHTSGNEIDERIAERYICIICGSKSKYVAMDNGKGSYRAFAVCKNCDNCVEF